MTTLEVILFIALTFVSCAYFYQAKYYREFNEDILSAWKRDRTTIKNLTKEGLFNSILNVDNFNTWFNSHKEDSNIYAHSGIFLRLDKLSTHHIEEYVSSITKCCLDFDNFNWEVIKDFEDKIREDWQNKLRQK